MARRKRRSLNALFVDTSAWYPLVDAGHGDHAALARALRRTVRLPPSVVEHATPEREDAAITEWLQKFDDQAFSLTDAVSFAVMKELGIEEVLGLDSHFATAGFRLLPDQP